jgi:hypothetical protein
MVNKLHTLKPRVVKLQRRRPTDPETTSKGGLVVVQALANRLRLWSDIKKFVPKRKDPTQGFPVDAVICALIHGLLSGGRGLSATEPLRDDSTLLKLLGLSAAPSAETVEEVVKYLPTVSAIGALNKVLRRLAARILGRMSRKRLLSFGYGFFPVWMDGSLLETKGKKFDAMKYMKEKWGQLCVAGFAGPALVAIDMAPEGKGEAALVRSFLEEVYGDTLQPLHLTGDVLILLDSLHGDEPTLKILESLPGKPAFLVGAQKLKKAHETMMEMPEVSWRETGPDPKRGWSASAWGRVWLQCDEWKTKRPMICHRWINEGELVTNYAGIITWLDQNDPRIQKQMKEWNLPVEETLWRLYGHKQGMENQWKELLTDEGLHHPPCAQAAANAIFYAIAGLAYNLSVGARELGLTEDEDRGMRLWRFRRDMIDLAATASHHAGALVARFLDGRDHLVERLLSAMERLAKC